MRSFRLAEVRSFRGSWSATQSGASSVGPSEHVGGKKVPPCLFAESPGAAPKRPPAIACRPLRGPDNRLSRIKPSLEQKSNLGPHAARAGNRLSLSAARSAGSGGAGNTQESPFVEVPAQRREAERDTTGKLAVSTVYIRGSGVACKGSVAGRQHSPLFAVHALRSD